MHDKIMAFLTLTGIDKFPDVIAAGLIDQIRSQFKTDEQLPDAFVQSVKLMEATLLESKPRLFASVVSAYEKSFTEAELDDMVAFYSSDVGKRIVALGGIVLPEVIEAGNNWGTESLKSIESELNKLLS